MSSLKKFDYRIKDNRKRNIFLCGIFLIVVTIVGVKLFNSHATFSDETDELNLANGETKVTCTDVVKPKYNQEITSFINILYKSNQCDELRIDETIDNNLRYIGATPDNYVWFNDELWRIIGVMNNIEDEAGNKNTRIKLIKAEGIGQIAWNASCENPRNESYAVDQCLTSVGDINKWEESTLQRLLNGPYLNSTQSEEYNRWTKNLTGFNFDRSIRQKTRRYEKIDFTESGIKEKYRNMIDTVKYSLGGPDFSNSKENYLGNLTPSLFYNLERSDYVYQGNQTEWTGQIGLMYPSDYGFATAGGIGIETSSEELYTTTLEMCMSIPINNWNLDDNVGCRDNNWFYKGEEIFQWTLSSYTDKRWYAVFVRDDGSLGGIKNYDSGTINAYLIRPVLYLKTNIKITGGTGTEDNPFTLAI